MKRKSDDCGRRREKRAPLTPQKERSLLEGLSNLYKRGGK